jgi:hypothetical protein
MKSGRFFTFGLILLFVICLRAGNALAFWGFGEDQGKSGLDFDKGYDLNTVTTVKGKVISVETDEDKGPVTIIVRQGAGRIHVVAAPEWYWSDRGIAIRPNDEIEATGAKAQGKDGNMYIISRKITNNSTGDSVTLRAGAGRPVWRGGAVGQGGGAGGMRMQHRMGGGMRGR